MRYLAFSPLDNLEANENISSAPIDMNQIIKMSAQVIIGAGSAGGNLQLQVSNDHLNAGQDFKNQVFTNWSNLGTSVVVTGTSCTLIAQQDMCYKALRAVYTDTTSGAATAEITVQILCLGM